MGAFIDITGKKFNNLTVIRRIENKGKYTIWECLCDCGKLTSARGTAIRNGGTKSCGCLALEFASTVNKSHGMSYTRFYRILVKMRVRCYDLKHINYYNYGGRGIIVCDQWLGKDGFIHFMEDMYESYNKHVEEFGEKNTFIERSDPNGNYEPANVRWATWSEQCLNKRDSTKTVNLKEHIRFRNIISNCINSCLLGRYKSSYVFLSYIGCTVEEFKKYLEDKFQDGMNWSNRGRSKIGANIWQLGHIIDCNKFDLTKEEDRKKCFHYTNLEPQWWEDNNKKRQLDFIN